MKVKVSYMGPDQTVQSAFIEAPGISVQMRRKDVLIRIRDEDRKLIGCAFYRNPLRVLTDAAIDMEVYG